MNSPEETVRVSAINRSPDPGARAASAPGPASIPAAITDLLDELLDVRGRDVLDVGCGEGWLVRRLTVAGARVVGIDPLASALELARREDPDQAARYIEGVAQALPFEIERFDIVILFNSLHHVPEEYMDAALAEAARVLRPAGLLYVQEPLADGELFELVRPVDDETHVRAAAQATLRRPHGGLVELAARTASTAIALADFDALRRMIVGVDPSRAVAVDAQEPALRAAFERLGHAAANGREFEQPIAVNLFRRGALAPVRPAH